MGESPLFCWAKAGTQIAGSVWASRRVRVLRAVAKALWLVGDLEPARKFSGGDGKREMELERIREAAERVARSVGMEVVDVEWKVGKERFLRVYIDKPEGISHKDCETVSNQLSVILDVEDLVPGALLCARGQLAWA